jgi:hypothetical protein
VYGASAYRADPHAGPPALVVGYGGLPESGVRTAVDQLALALAECTQRQRSGGP